MIYAWKQHSGTSKLDAQSVGEHFYTLQRKHNGTLTPKMVLDSARDSASLLHDAFEWDDTVAAEEWRTSQASGLIRNITVRITPEAADGTTYETRAFFSVQLDRKPVYVPMLHALTSNELRSQVLARALSDLREFRHRYDDLIEITDLLNAAENALIEQRQALLARESREAPRKRRQPALSQQ